MPDLQKVDIEKLVEAADAIRLRVLPERDGKFLPLDAYEAYANGAAKDLDFMQGCNKDEMNYFLFCAGGPEPFMDFLNERLTTSLTRLTAEERALVESFYKDVKGEVYDPLCRLYDQIWFIAPVFRQAENQTKSGGKSYTYFFTPESSLPLLRCGHSLELPVIFNLQEITLWRWGGPSPPPLKDHAPHSGSICQDGQPVAQRIRVARWQGQGVAALRPREQTADDLRRVQHPPREGIAAEDPRLGPHLFPDQVLLSITNNLPIFVILHKKPLL